MDKEFSIKQIQFCESDMCDMYPEQVDQILEALNHPEAFVTDESQIADFISDYLPKSMQESLINKFSKFYGREVQFSEHIGELAKELYSKGIS